MIRQPDVCLCFGGRCWKQFCPEKGRKESDPHTAPKGRDKKRPKKVLTLRDSLRELEENKDE